MLTRAKTAAALRRRGTLDIWRPSPPNSNRRVYEFDANHQYSSLYDFSTIKSKNFKAYFIPVNVVGGNFRVNIAPEKFIDIPVENLTKEIGPGPVYAKINYFSGFYSSDDSDRNDYDVNKDSNNYNHNNKKK